MISFKSTAGEIMIEATEKARTYGKVTDVRVLDHSDTEATLMITFATPAEVISASVRIGGVIFGYTSLILKVVSATNNTKQSPEADLVS